MATTRFENLPEQKQAKILDAAAEEFAQNSYEAASINQIIERAGISKGSMYYYFEGKADLYETVVERATRRLMDLAGDFSLEDLERDNFWPSLLEYGHQVLQKIVDQGDYIRLVSNFYQIYQPDDPDSPGTGVVDQGQVLIESIIARGQKVGAIRQDLPTEFLIHTAMSVGMAFDRWFLKQWQKEDGGISERVLIQTVDFFQRMFAPNK